MNSSVEIMSVSMLYLPKRMRGRVNSTHGLLWNIGAIIGAVPMGSIAE